MGRLITACVLSLTFLVFAVIWVTYMVTIGITTGLSHWELFIWPLLLLGVILPIPAALILNLRDWLRAWNHK